MSQAIGSMLPPSVETDWNRVGHQGCCCVGSNFGTARGIGLLVQIPIDSDNLATKRLLVLMFSPSSASSLSSADPSDHLPHLTKYTGKTQLSSTSRPNLIKTTLCIHHKIQERQEVPGVEFGMAQRYSDQTCLERLIEMNYALGWPVTRAGSKVD
ncbi:hypothetical protein DL95DRAFT_410948 [Leptodontidium sp. 2 PMI_412]|nr:hypothetical protein DL95DRAFT_410948 [Leptodontidium sp. 2 PMI_412]